MTMSQLLKQTKKCCVKIIRKFSSGSPSSAGGDGDVVTSGGGGGGGRSISLNNKATAKYVLHKNCTPTRCKIQPTASEGFGEATASWTHEGTDDALHSPVRRRPESFASPSEREVPVTQNNYRASRDVKNLQKKRTNITSNKNVNIRKCFRLRKGFKDELGGEEMNNSSSAVTSKLDKINKTLYLVARGGSHQEDVVYSESKVFSGVNSNNLNSQNSEKSKISKPLFLSGKQKKYNQIETQFSAEDGVDFDDHDDDEIMPYELDAIRAESDSYDSGRLQFELRQPLPETSEASPRPSGSSYKFEDVVFEKVKFDRNKRYLRNGTTSSPSTTSNLSHSGSGVAHSVGSVLSISFECDSEHPLSQYAGVASKSEDFIDSWRNYNVNSRWNKVAKNPWDAEAQKSIESPVMFSHDFPSWSQFIDESPASSPVPHRLSANKTYPPPYQVRTDIWQNLNNKNYEIDSDVFWRTSNSSRRTSASTVETWIEDEAFDNSFNEELERRCATLKI